MSYKRTIIDSLVWLVTQTVTVNKELSNIPKSIFVLRNNDLGDVLVITPLFQALRQLFPNAYIVAGVGQWNVDTIKLNPYISEILPINAPWYNKFISQQNLLDKLKYIAFSSESSELAKRSFDVGIDVLGSYYGSMLMMRVGIPYRLGVRGYAGGHTAVQRYVEYSEYEHVGRSALRFAELLGATELPECRPQIFLSDSEREVGERHWSKNVESWEQRPRRIIVAPGGGFIEKCWPLENYVELVKMLSSINNVKVIIVGGKQDREAGIILSRNLSCVKSFAGELTIRETFALAAAADLVICNSSMLMHVAAAFSLPAVVLLGDYFNSSKQHLTQWGYPGLSYILGKELDCPKIYTPLQVMEIIKTILKSTI